MLVDDMEIGVATSDVLIIISFDELFGDITFNFSLKNWGEAGLSIKQKTDYLLEKIIEIASKITYKSIILKDELDDDNYLINIEK